MCVASCRYNKLFSNKDEAFFFLNEGHASFLHQGSVLYPLMIAVHSCGSCDMDSTAVTACVDAMSVSASACAAKRGQACVAGRIVMEFSSSLSGQISYGAFADSIADSLEIQRVTGSQESASATVFSPPLMYMILASNCDMNSIQHA